MVDQSKLVGASPLQVAMFSLATDTDRSPSTLIVYAKMAKAAAPNDPQWDIAIANFQKQIDAGAGAGQGMGYKVFGKDVTYVPATTDTGSAPSGMPTWLPWAAGAALLFFLFKKK